MGNSDIVIKFKNGSKITFVEYDKGQSRWDGTGHPMDVLFDTELEVALFNRAFPSEEGKDDTTTEAVSAGSD